MPFLRERKEKKEEKKKRLFLSTFFLTPFAVFLDGFVSFFPLNCYEMTQTMDSNVEGKRSKRINGEEGGRFFRFFTGEAKVKKKNHKAHLSTKKKEDEKNRTGTFCRNPMSLRALLESTQAKTLARKPVSEKEEKREREREEETNDDI